MSFFKDLIRAIEDGLSGKNKGISLGLERLERYVSLRKRIYYMILGSTGSGKSSLLHDAFILNPLEIIQATGLNVKLKIILFSMERGKTYLHAKWLARRIFLDTQRIIPINRLLNWYGESLNNEEQEVVKEYEDYFDFLEEHIDIYEGSRSAADIFRIVKGYAEEHGEDRQISEYKKMYVPKDDTELVVVMVDHFGLTKITKEHPTKKQAIDKLSEHFQYFRDHLGYSVVGVNQLNRDLSNPIYQKLDSFEPHLDNAKETGTTTEAADCILSLFEPLRYGTNDRFYGDVSKFRHPENGHKYFRNVKILKNTYGADDVSVGVAFQGELGMFTELEKSSKIKEMTEKERKKYIESIFDNSIFLK